MDIEEANCRIDKEREFFQTKAREQQIWSKEPGR